MKRRIKPKEVDGVIKVDATLERKENKNTICLVVRDVHTNYYYGYVEIDIKRIK